MLANSITLLGGIGLFLLGMRLMTDGLTQSAGNALRDILASATRSQPRALGSGLLITTAVQSSSAVLFATIGFVNAGLLSLGQAIGIVYGANLGTTLTSWLVALAGFSLNLRALALPAIGIGALAWAIARNSRRGALGQAIAGFGLFFLGLDVLREAFDGLDSALSLDGQVEGGIAGIAMFVATGIVITLLTQSSSATLAITLTAAASGLLPLQAAAAMIVGANVGTTSTAVFASIGATAPARRVAAAHVVFNVVTAAVALALLPALLWLAGAISGLVMRNPNPALPLAVFHTLTKLLGIGLMWPLTGRFVAMLERRFRSAGEDQARPQHLDGTLLATPALALAALGMELRRMGTLAAELGLTALDAPQGRRPRLAAGHEAMTSLEAAIGEYAAGIHHQALDSDVVEGLPHALRVAHYQVGVTELAQELARLRPQAHLEVAGPARCLAQIREDATAVLRQAGEPEQAEGTSPLTALLDAFETSYQAFKASLLRAGATGQVQPRRMTAVLEYGSVLHRLCDQATKAATHLAHFPPGRREADTIEGRPERM